MKCYKKSIQWASFLLVFFVNAATNAKSNELSLNGTSTPDDEVFVSLSLGVRVLDAFGPFVHELNVLIKDPYGDINVGRHSQLLVLYGFQSNVLNIPGNLVNYYTDDLNGDGVEELIVHYKDRYGSFLLEVYSSGLAEDRETLYMQKLNNTVVSSNVEGVTINKPNKLILVKNKNNGKVVEEKILVSQAFDFSPMPVKRLIESLK